MSTQQVAVPVLDQLCINTIRTLSIDAVQQAKSGHPGTPMALAPLVYTLWNRVMRFDPKDPIWPNRDRFVLSNGHASMLLWSVLHLTKTQAVNADYESVGQPSVTLDDIRHFRQLDSKAPGHPEYHWVSGVEATTGPLGQGIATSVGMAIAQKWLAARYNRPGFDIFDYNIYAVCGDGCLMEGVGSEAASLAGASRPRQPLLDLRQQPHHHRRQHAHHLHRRRRGPLHGLRLERAAGRRRQRSSSASSTRSRSFRQTKGRPTLIILDSHIGYGSPHKQRHRRGARRAARRGGSPPRQARLRLARGRASSSCPTASTSISPQGIGAARRRGPRSGWMKLFDGYREAFPDLAAEIDQMQRRELPAGWDRNLPVFPADPKGIAGRDASGKVLNVLAQNIPWFLGGSADLGPSNKTTLKFEGAGDFEPDSPGGKNLHFGIREHAMAAIVNGLSLSKLRPFGATFFIFSDYARPAIRLSALMELPTIFVFTHDAMGDGEDGPTHQPVEQLASLRAIPGLVTLRPADANEVVEAYRYILQLRHKPAVLVLSRQPLPTFDRSKYAPASGVARGAYVLADPPGGDPEIILIASGSEVSAGRRRPRGAAAPRASARAWSRCPPGTYSKNRATNTATASCRPPVAARIAIEQASTFGWERYTGVHGRVIGMQTFGASAPLKELQRRYGFEPENLVAAAKTMLGK